MFINSVVVFGSLLLLITVALGMCLVISYCFCGWFVMLALFGAYLG